ncbi:MAG: FAD-binding oxidoreductase, partial [Bacteroidia bacterium]|nr:FAD-binding oxidoreductase [Bacteroidia bacterium]
MELSYWEKTSAYANYDVIIVGSGIVGLSTSIFLKKINPDLNVCVVDRGHIPTGASTKNAGFACFGSLSELIDDEQSMQPNEVIELVEKRWRGLQLLKQLVNKDTIEYENNGGYELFTEQDELLYRNCLDRMDFYNSELNKIIGENVYSEYEGAAKHFGFNNVSHVIYNDYEAQLNPVLLIKELNSHASSLGVTMLNGLQVDSIQKSNNEVEVICNDNLIIKGRIATVCTNGFAEKLLPNLNVEAHRAQVLITFPVPQHKLKGVFHYDKGYYYFRNIGERILIGGARNADFDKEQTDSFGITDT